MPMNKVTVNDGRVTLVKAEDVGAGTLMEGTNGGIFMVVRGIAGYHAAYLRSGQLTPITNLRGVVLQAPVTIDPRSE